MLAHLLVYEEKRCSGIYQSGLDQYDLDRIIVGKGEKEIHLFSAVKKKIPRLWKLILHLLVFLHVHSQELIN